MIFSRASCLACILGAALVSTAHAQSTAFTYQGRLKNGAALAAGLHDLRFRLFDVASGGTQVGTTQCADNVSVSDGLFTTTIDFGQQYATTAQRFLEIAVRADTGLTCTNATGFTLLSPRQLLTAAPMASHAKAAFALDAADGSPANAVYVDNAGNVGIGTTAPQAPLHVKASGQGIRIEGQSTGVNNSAYLAFANGAGTDLGYIGDGSSGDNSMYLTSYANDVYLYTAAGAALSAKPSGNVGIGTTAPLAKLDVRGNIKLGSTGQFFAPGGEENLRIVRGVVLANGSIFAGSGFTVTPISFGRYRLNFQPAFANPPAVTVDFQFNSSSTSGPFSADWGSLSSSSVDIRLYRFDGAFTDGDFSFIAIGPR